MDSDHTWFHIGMPDVSLRWEPLTHFVTFIVSAAAIGLFLLIVAHSALYLFADVVFKWEHFFIIFGFSNYMWVLLNGALIHTLTLFIFRGFISFWIFLGVTIAYAAVVKSIGGHFFMGLALDEYWGILIMAVYVSTITELGALFNGTLGTALSYRTY